MVNYKVPSSLAMLISVGNMGAPIQTSSKHNECC